MIEWLIGGAVATYLYKKASDKGDIICAARNNPDPAIINGLIRKGYNIETDPVNSGYTPLMMAIKHNPNPEIARILIRSGAYVNQMGAMDSMTPLSLLMQQENPSMETLELLLEKGALVSIPDCNMVTPLDYAKKLKCPDLSSIICKLELKKLFELDGVTEYQIKNNPNHKISIFRHPSSPLIYKMIEETDRYQIGMPFYFDILPRGTSVFIDKTKDKSFIFQVYKGKVLYLRDENGNLTSDSAQEFIQYLLEVLCRETMQSYNKNF